MEFKHIFPFYLAILLVPVHALQLVIQPQTIVGEPTLVLWSIEDGDHIVDVFDLRFVQAGTDVGLAAANIQIKDADNYGTAFVTFPTGGFYSLVAVCHIPGYPSIGSSGPTQAIPISSSLVAPLPKTSNSNVSPTSSIAAASVSSQDNPPVSTAVPTAGTPPTSTPASPSTVPAQSTDLPNSSSFHLRGPNFPAIVGGIVGALVLVGLLGIAFIIFARRDRLSKKRFTFHRDLMVQQLPEHPQEGDDNSEITSANNPDIEAGLIPKSNCPPLTKCLPSSSSVVPVPKGPRPRRHPGTAYNSSNSSSTSSLPLLSERQRQLSDRAAQLRGQIHEMERQKGKPHILEEMRRELAWLEDQKMSPWAMGMTDTLPSSYTRYMTA